MTNTKLLQSKMLELDFTVAKLALAVNLSTTGLFNKIHNKREFHISEMLNISECLKLTNEERELIFFAKQVELNSTQKEKL